ncbi:MAG TPA: hypothetical protein VFE27_22235 [Acidobacteriaceae bacterium]|nr:hypothetical protein [Acidobacteriaceae bacterium]
MAQQQTKRGITHLRRIARTPYNITTFLQLLVKWPCYGSYFTAQRFYSILSALGRQIAEVHRPGETDQLKSDSRAARFLLATDVDRIAYGVGASRERVEYSLL